MLDGKVDVQGTVKDLRARGLLEEIQHDAALEAYKESVVAADQAASGTGDEINAESPTDQTAEAKKPRKLIKDEHRETGGVKWSIYKSYLKASSYWIWVLLGFFVVVQQLLGITEKLWIKVCLSPSVCDERLRTLLDLGRGIQPRHIRICRFFPVLCVECFW